MLSTASTHCKTRVAVNSKDDWRRAIARYDRDVRAGNVRFDREGFATSYPGQAGTDKSISEFITSHVALA